MDLQQYIKSYKDFPAKGVIFRDISPVLANPKAFKFAIDSMVAQVEQLEFNKILAIDARGFLFAGSLADRLQKGLILCRKPSKLPGDLATESYGYEYSTDSLSVQKNAIQSSDKILIVDDVLATGNTLLAAYKLVTKLGGSIAGVACFIELGYLNGRQLLKENNENIKIYSVLNLEK
jgi:adenine phosphoribosyltransferase